MSNLVIYDWDKLSDYQKNVITGCLGQRNVDVDFYIGEAE